MSQLMIGHRGVCTEHPENTQEAFEQAWEEGMDMVEFDVQLTSDNVPIIFHDDDFKRMLDRGETVRSVDAKSLFQYKITGKAKRYTIPRLEDLIKFHGDKPHYIELKVPDHLENLQEYREKLNEESLRCISGFSKAENSYLASFDLELLDLVFTEGRWRGTLVPTFDSIEKIKEHSEKGYSFQFACFEAKLYEEQKDEILKQWAKGYIFLYGLKKENAQPFLDEGVLGVIVDS